MLQAAHEFQQMKDRRVVTEDDAKLLLLRIKFIMYQLSPADMLELELLCKMLLKGASGDRGTL